VSFLNKREFGIKIVWAAGCPRPLSGANERLYKFKLLENETFERRIVASGIAPTFK
jgi:hypothetical protein